MRNNRREKIKVLKFQIENSLDALIKSGNLSFEFVGNYIFTLYLTSGGQKFRLFYNSTKLQLYWVIFCKSEIFFLESLNSKNPDQAKEVLLDAGRNNVDKVLDVLEDVIKSEKTKFHEKLQKISPNVPIPEKPAEIRPHPDVSMIKNESILTVVSGCVQLH